MRFIQIKSNGDAVEMVNVIPQKKRYITMYITGGGRKRYHETRIQGSWSRAFFEETKCDIILNNLCESFNSSIVLARDKPILAMLERIRMNTIIRNVSRRVAYEKWKDVVGPRIKKMLDKAGQRATQNRAHRGSEFVFQVTGFGENGSQHAVDLGLHTCTCKRWQLSGIPCVHSICCIRFKKQEAALYCDYLMCTTYMQAYTPVINLIVGDDDWEPVDFLIATASLNKLPGRPRKKRFSSQGENGNPAPSTLTEGKFLKIGGTMTCKLCGQERHNRVGCPITKAKKAAETEERTSGGGASTKKRVRANVQMTPAPPKESRHIKDQVIKFKKEWKKIKLVMEGTSARHGGASDSTQPSTQSSQTHAAKGVENI